MPSSRARRAAARRAAAARRRRFAGMGGIVVIAAVGLLLATRDGVGEDVAPKPSDVQERSDALPGRDDRLRVGDEPRSYRIAFRVETFADDERIVTRDDIVIDRPFQGRTSKRSGPESDSPIRSEQVAVLGRLSVPDTGESDEALLETGVAIAPSDLRIAPVLDFLVASGKAELREWRTVLDTPCQVIRFGGPITSGTVAAVLDPALEYADACVSERGLVLEELWVVEGLVQRHRIAVELELEDDAAVAASVFAPAASPTVEPVPVDEGGGSFRPIQPDSAYAAPFWVADEPPLDRYRGRWAVVIPASSDPEEEETKERRIGAVVDIWDDGLDVVVVEQGSTAGGVKPFDLGSGPRLSVEGLGEGEVVVDLRMSEIRFRRPGGYFVRVSGTLDPARLETIARGLVETPGGTGIVYLED